MYPILYILKYYNQSDSKGSYSVMSYSLLSSMNKQMELISIWKTSQHNKDLNLNVILYKVHKHWSPKEYILFSSGIKLTSNYL